MSVINKMLKDLEDRDQEQGTDFDPSGAVYQAKEKSKLPLLLASLVVVILGLGGAVAWLLMNQTNKTNAQLSAILQQQPTPEPVQQSTAQETVAQETSAEQIQAPVEQSPVMIQAPEPLMIAAPEPAAEQTVNSEAMANNEASGVQAQQLETVETTNPIESDEFDDAYFDSEEFLGEDFVPDNQPEPEPVQEQPQFKIEKSVSNLTREERIEKLMTQAQESFDKGYISDAITQLDEVIASADNHVEARNLLAVAWYGRGELQQAVNILNDGLSRYPATEKWRVTAAKIFFKENEHQGAFTYLEANLADASTEYYSMQGTLARQLKRFDKAELAYANLTRIEPEKANWWLGYAIALDSQKKSAMAKQSYQQAISKAGLSPASVKFAQQRIEQLQDE